MSLVRKGRLLGLSVQVVGKDPIARPRARVPGGFRRKERDVGVVSSKG